MWKTGQPEKLSTLSTVIIFILIILLLKLNEKIKKRLSGRAKSGRFGSSVVDVNDEKRGGNISIGVRLWTETENGARCKTEFNKKAGDTRLSCPPLDFAGLVSRVLCPTCRVSVIYLRRQSPAVSSNLPPGVGRATLLLFDGGNVWTESFDTIDSTPPPE